MSLVDLLGRPLRSLRVSVTDRCNLRCQYCMPEEEYAWLPREDLLVFEEIVRSSDVFAGLGVDKVRLTGRRAAAAPEPPELVAPARRRTAADRPGADHQRRPAGRAGRGASRRRADARHRQPRHAAPRPLHGAHPAHHATRACSRASSVAARLFDALKIDTRRSCAASTTTRLVPLVEYARARRAEVRFIEYMDVGGATHWSPDKVVSGAEILAAARGALRRARADRRDGLGAGRSLPAARRHACRRHRLDDAPVLQHLRSRAPDGRRHVADVPLRDRRHRPARAAARGDAAATNWRRASREAWRARTDRGAELRAAERERGVYIPAAALKGDPHLEMHTRGG